MLRPLRGLVAGLLPSSNEPNYELIHANGTANDDTFSHLKLSFTRFLFFLIPSPIQRRLQPAHFKPQRLYATSYLDGLRGFMIPSYGLPIGDPVPSSFMQLPFLRVLYSGRPMVHIFFVISGFVLSLKPLKLARAHNYADLQTTLSSSVFRRGMRLFLPTTASTFLVMTFIRMRLVEVDGFETFSQQFMDWLHAIWTIGYSWDWDKIWWPKYDVHVWTIPIEMAQSMFLFVTITGLARCKVWVRLFMFVVIMLYSLKCGRWAAFEFIGGALVAEVGLIQQARAERNPNKEMPDSDEESSGSWQTSVVYAFWSMNFVFAMWIAGWPNNDVLRTPGLSEIAPYTMEPYWSQRRQEEQAFSWFALGPCKLSLLANNFLYCKSSSHLAQRNILQTFHMHCTLCMGRSSTYSLTDGCQLFGG
ncbi:hard surface induced protein [Botrytis cinerea]